MDNLEKVIKSHPLFQQCVFWHRYVDDILVCFKGTDRQFKNFENLLNSLHPNIKFSTEIETNTSINFLDLTITRLSNKLDFSIYRKPSHTDTTIHYTSNHPYQHKVAAYNSMIHRLLHIPLSTQNFDKELQIIKQIAINNGYKPNMVDNIVKNKKYKLALSQVFPSQKETNNFKIMSYIPHTSEKLRTLFSKQNIKTAFRTDNNLSKFIKNNKSRISKPNKSGVYKLSCGSCDKIYIGRTFRNFKTRISEHKRSYIQKKLDSQYAGHLLTENHQFKEEFEILKTGVKGLKLNLCETLEINKHKRSGNLLNIQTDLMNNSPLLNLQLSENKSLLCTKD